MNIIAFAGKAGSGKSTACEVLKSKGYEVLNFADPLKEIAAMLLDIPLEWCYSQEQKEKPRSLHLYAEDIALLLNQDGYEMPASLQGPAIFQFNSLRQVLQFVGTEIYREADKDFWINKLLNKLEPGKNYCIGDSRFPNELQAIKHKGGITVMISRPGLKSLDLHPSELTNILETDFTIHNTDLELFKSDVNMVEELYRHGKGQKKSF